ncbi:MAG: hypothetical protein WA532_12155 [Candidatus Korobacteraceae bacterium]
MAKRASSTWRDPPETLEGLVFMKFSSSSGLQLEDRDNFRAFKLVIEGEQAQLDAVRNALTGKAELADAGTAWIFEDALRRWPGLENDAAWQQNFSAMIEKARPHGWIDDQRKAIKAHVEWVAG